MFQPVGGMDRIAVAIERNLTHSAIRNAEVRRIRQKADGVEVVYVDRRSGAAHKVQGDYVVCTIPFPVLASIDHDSPGAISRCNRRRAV